MTYTMTYKDYTADTFAASAAEMLVDPDIWLVNGMEREGSILAVIDGGGTDSKGYAVDHIEWDGRTLRVWFR